MVCMGGGEKVLNSGFLYISIYLTYVVNTIQVFSYIFWEI